MVFSRGKVKGHVALTAPRLGGMPTAPDDLEAQRDGVFALFTQVGALKGTADGADARVLTDDLSFRLVAMVHHLIGHDLGARRARLSDAAHFGRLVGLLEPNLPGYDPERSHPHAATVLLYVAVQSGDADKLYEQLTVWALQASYWLTRTRTHPDALLNELRAQILGLLAADGPTVPAQRRVVTEPRSRTAPVAEMARVDR
ncbi:MAG: hypothetical protein ACT4QG_19570 [Sporichthyaceae bacterium]